MVDKTVWGYEIVVGGVSWMHDAYAVFPDLEDGLDPGGQSEYMGDLQIITDGELGKLLDTQRPDGTVQVWDGSKAVFRTADREIDFYSASLGPCGLVAP
jgi:hypothetical protein